MTTRNAAADIPTPAGRVRATEGPRVRPVVVVLVGLAVTIVGAMGSWVPSLWYDEGATVLAASRSWTALGEVIRSIDLVHATYYSIMHVWLDLVGFSPFTVRLPSAIAVGASASLLVLIVDRLIDPKTAVVAGLVLGLLPRTTWAAAEGRSYALTILLTCGLSLLLLACLGVGGRARALSWVAYVVLAVFSITVFAYLALLVLAHAVTVVVLALSGVLGRKSVARFAVAAALSGALAAPFLIAAHGQLGQLAWIVGAEISLPNSIVFGQYFTGNHLLAGAVLVVGAIAVVMLVQRWRAREVWAKFALGLFVPVLVVPLVVLLLVSFVGESVYVDRYLTFTLPALAAILAVPIGMLRTSSAVAATVLLALLASPDYLDQRRLHRAPWLEVAQTIAADHGREGVTAVVFERDAPMPDGSNAHAIMDVYPWAFEGVVDLTLDVPFQESDGLWASISPVDASDLEGIDAVWLVESHPADGARDERVIRSEGFVKESDTEIGYMRLVLFVRS